MALNMDFSKMFEVRDRIINFDVEIDSNSRSHITVVTDNSVGPVRGSDLVLNVESFEDQYKTDNPACSHFTTVYRVEVICIFH